MDEKKFEKAVDILLDQQAQLSADMAEMKEHSFERLSTVERATVNLVNHSLENSTQIAEQSRIIAEQSRNIDKLTADVAELREGQKETNERLDIVIFMAEKFFGSNGTSKK
jgi:ABC-type nitrate/sulfonate/bicarbonate transport system ATPase subunit